MECIEIYSGLDGHSAFRTIHAFEASPVIFNGVAVSLSSIANAMWKGIIKRPLSWLCGEAGCPEYQRKLAAWLKRASGIKIGLP